MEVARRRSLLLLMHMKYKRYTKYNKYKSISRAQNLPGGTVSPEESNILNGFTYSSCLQICIIDILILHFWWFLNWFVKMDVSNGVIVFGLTNGVKALKYPK